MIDELTTVAGGDGWGEHEADRLQKIKVVEVQ